MDNNLKEILNQVKSVEGGINQMLIPLLQDTIADANKHNRRLFILAVLELLIILATVFGSLILVYRQNVKYQEFLSQFDFETTETVYQDTDDNSSINSGINYNK